MRWREAHMAGGAPKLLIRADAAPKMGTGHVMRCLALAAHARTRGWAPILAGHVAVPWVVERLRREGVDFLPLPGPPPEREDPEALRGLIQTHRPLTVALDGYHFGPEAQRAARTLARLLVIDDYAHLKEYYADTLLNQNAGAEALAYGGDIGRKLIGPHYALLRPEFLRARPKAETRAMAKAGAAKAIPENILLTLGGGDFIEQIKRLAPPLSTPEMAGRRLTVLTGAMDQARLRAALAKCPARIELATATDDMPRLLLETDLCITAGGSTVWELCCLGVPFLTVEVAENQRGIIETLALKNLAPPLSRAALTEALTLPDPQRPKSLMNFVDGRGALKALDFLGAE